uniref:C2H2-type domain-containing protein n=1 Tax=Timema genevievae TaxID=629358 RepID=A0A7R9K473_TIMGE|nr:unnamed protein product [Timema genevievae]
MRAKSSGSASTSWGGRSSPGNQVRRSCKDRLAARQAIKNEVLFMKKRYGNGSDFPFVPVKEELDEPPGPCSQPSGESGNYLQILDNNVKSEEEDEDAVIYPAYLDKYCLCDRCGIFVFNSRLSQHMLVHTGQKPYSCPICGRGFTQSNSLREHRVVHNRERHYTCEVCGQQFLRRGNLRDHKKVHFKERVFYCHICERRFTDRRALRKHNFTHTGEKPFSCDTCERKFASQSHLRRHSLTHNNQWRFQCDYCSYTFIQKGNFRLHLRTQACLPAVHSKERNMDSSVKCGFSQQEYYSRMQQLMCTVCERPFSKKMYVESHMLTHSNIV